MALPITIVGIDTDPVSHPLTRFAIKRTLLAIDVREVLFFGGKPLGLGESFFETQRFDSMDSYSEFVLKCMWPYIKTDFILIVHWDGFAINPAGWREEFLQYDYVGATWAWANDDMRVGNGGFCLRSRKLVNLCKDVRVRRHPEIPYGGIEDILICRLYRKFFEENGCKFAPVDVAERFSYESGTLTQYPFGFHGPANMPLFLPESMLLDLMPSLLDKIKPGTVRDQFLAYCRAKKYNDLANAMETD